MILPIPGYTKACQSGFWFKDSDGTGPFGMDDTTSPPTPYLVGQGNGGAGGGGVGIDGVIVQDSTGTQGIRREVDTAGVIVVSFVNMDGTAWSPTLPIVAISPTNQATAANQATQIAAEQAIQAGIGAVADAPAASDTANGSVISYVKRIAARLSSILTQLTTNVVVSATAATASSSAAYEASHVGKASAGTLFSVSIFNSASFGQFYQLHDAAAEPANATAPKSVIFVPSKGAGGWDFGLRGRPFSTGIVVSNSTTGPALTAGAADSYYDLVVG